MPQSVTWGKWEKLGVMKSIMDIIWVWWRKWGQIQFSITVKPVLSRHPWEWHSIQGGCLKLYSATEDRFDCSSWIDWLDQNKKKYENIPDMRDVEGGRGIGFDRNVGWKGGGGVSSCPRNNFSCNKTYLKEENYFDGYGRCTGIYFDEHSLSSSFSRIKSLDMYFDAHASQLELGFRSDVWRAFTYLHVWDKAFLDKKRVSI